MEPAFAGQTRATPTSPLTPVVAMSAVRSDVLLISQAWTKFELRYRVLGRTRMPDLVPDISLIIEALAYCMRCFYTCPEVDMI